MAVVALITDFGTTDWYAGALKGSILTIDETIPLVDITHSVSPGNITQASFTLSAAFNSFPERTVFCSVVDPGVRSSRRAIAAFVNRRYLVGPDNGILSFVLNDYPDAVVRCIENYELLGILSGSPDSSFHKHDLFGLAAGFLASRGTFSSIGDTISDYVRLPWPETTTIENVITTSVLSIDRFGNIITAAPADVLDQFKGKNVKIRSSTQTIDAVFAECYRNVAAGGTLVYCGSTERVEIAVHGGRATDLLPCNPGETIRISVG